MFASLRFFSVLIVVSVGLTAAFCCTQFVQAGDEVFRVAGKPYTAKELCGSTLVELRKTFDDEVRTFSDDRVRELLSRQGVFQQHPELKDKLQDRTALQEALWNNALTSFLDYAVNGLVLAHITDEIVKQHGIDLEDYFDAQPLRDALKREMKYLDFNWKHKDDPLESEDALYDEVVKEFRMRSDRKFYRFVREEIRRRSPFTRWNAEVFRRNDQFGEYGLKAILANYLLRQACEEGIYNERGRELFQLPASSFRVLEVSGYRGSKAALEEFLSKVVDKEGELSSGGIKVLREWLREGTAGISVKLDTVLDSTLSNGYSLPSVGVLYQSGPNDYRIYLLGQGSKQRTEDTDKQPNILAKRYGYRLAVSEFLPTIDSLVEGWKPDLETINGWVTLPGVGMMVPEVEVDTFVKRDYPGEAFRDFEEQRKDLQTYAVRAATVSVDNDAKGAQALINEVEGQAHSAKTAPVQKAYEAIVQRLATKFPPADQKKKTAPTRVKGSPTSQSETFAGKKVDQPESRGRQKAVTADPPSSTDNTPAAASKGRGRLDGDLEPGRP